MKHRLPRTIEKPQSRFGHLLLNRLPKAMSCEMLSEWVRRKLLAISMTDTDRAESLLKSDLSVWYTLVPAPKAEA
jgi:hypothetical protein